MKFVLLKATIILEKLVFKCMTVNPGVPSRRDTGRSGRDTERARDRRPRIFKSAGPLSDGEELMQIVYARRSNKLNAEMADLRSFSHVPESEITRDELLVKQLKRQFAETQKSARGQVMERFLEHEIEASDWFSGAYVVKTHPYDDYRNGVDLVLEWDPEEEGGLIPRLAVDITSSVSTLDIEKKLNKLLRGAEVKYFRSEAEAEKTMSLSNLPIVILGVDASLLPTLGEVAKEQKRMVRGTEDIGQRAFTEHSVKFLLLEQARVQLDKQVVYLCAQLIKNMARPRPSRVSEALLAFRQGDDSADSIVDSIGRLDSSDLIVDENLKSRWFNALACKRRIDSYLEIEYEDLEKNTARLSDVREWMRESDTHREITS